MTRPPSPHESHRPLPLPCLPALLVPVVIVGLLAWTVAPPGARAAWRTEDVDGPHDYIVTRMALDGLGRPAIALGGGSLCLARFDGAAWSVEEVAAVDCQLWSLDLAFDGASNPVVAWVDELPGDLWLGRHDGSGWSFELVDGGWVDGVALALDAASSPLLAYVDRVRGELRLARRGGTGFALETIDTGTFAVRSTSLALDASGRPLVAYVDEVRGSLELASWTGSAWALETVDPTGTIQGWTSLAVDASGDPVIAYLSHNDRTGNDTLRLARRNGPAWAIASVDPQGASTCSLRLDPADRAVVGYYDEPRGRVKVARETGTGFAVEVVETLPWPDESGWTSLALDATLAPLVSYSDGALGALKLARREAAGWLVEVVASDHRVGTGVSLAVGPDGRALISHVDSNEGSVRLVREAAPAYQAETIPGSGPAWDTSLAVDAAGQPAVAWYDPVDHDLEVARFDGSAWTVDTVDAAGDVGAFASLAADARGRLLVAYHDEGNGDLRLARFDGSAWTLETVDAQGDVGEWASLALDPAGLPTIAHHDGGNGDLRLARFDGSAWTLETVDAQGDVGLYPSLALDATGNPWVSYFDQTLRRLRLAHLDGATWRFETVTGGWPGGESSLRLDAGGQPAIAFTAWGPGQGVRLARRQGPGFAVEEVDPDGTAYVSLGLAPGDVPVVACWHNCRGCLRRARPAVAAVLYRGVVDDLAPSWKAARLPLDDSNDLALAPFPLATSLGESATDALDTGAPLVLYRALAGGSGDAGNVLRVTRDAAGAVLLGY
jgi:hypothetical protein